MRKALPVFFLAISCLLLGLGASAQVPTSQLKFTPPLLTTPIFMDAAGRIYAPNTTLFDLQGRKLTNFVWSGTAGDTVSSNLTLLGVNGSLTVAIGTNGSVQFTLSNTNGTYIYDRPISVPGITGNATNQFVGTNQFQVYVVATSNTFQAYTNWAHTNFLASSTFASFLTTWQNYTNWTGTNFNTTAAFNSFLVSWQNYTNSQPVAMTNIATSVFTSFTTLWQPSANGSVCPSGQTWTDSSWVGNTNQIYPQ